MLVRKAGGDANACAKAILSHLLLAMPKCCEHERSNCATISVEIATLIPEDRMRQSNIAKVSIQHETIQIYNETMIYHT